MSVALLGIGLVQIVWIKWQYEHSEHLFDDKVVLALSDVEKKLYGLVEKELQKARMAAENPLFRKSLEKHNRFLSPSQRKLSLSLKKNDYRYLDPVEKLTGIDIEKLDKVLKQAIADQDVDLKYDYGVFSNEMDNFFIVNGNYVAIIDADDQYSSAEANMGLQRSEYKIDLFEEGDIYPGYLKLFFPKKNNWLWSEIVPSMVTSLIFTGLVLFCFVYTMWIIFRQKEVSEMKTDFINNMTHEFKTPIATISLATDSILTERVINDKDKLRKFAGIIKQENVRMLNQVEKVLQMAKIDKREFDLKISQVDMHHIILQAAHHNNLKVSKRGGKITTKLNAKNAFIDADATHLANVIHNLLDNANKYSKENPQIIIETRNIGDKFRVSVSDEGIGMNKEALKNIFHKFYRVHTGNLHDVKGFGLGLSYVKVIVDAHKGNIDVRSELGKGSTFILTFPVNYVT